VKKTAKKTYTLALGDRFLLIFGDLGDKDGKVNIALVDSDREEVDAVGNPLPIDECTVDAPKELRRLLERLDAPRWVRVLLGIPASRL
jgi:hypothetical protein